jgi:Na+-driven multidrug efflux pump
MLAFGIKIVIMFSPKDSYKLKVSELRLHPQHLKQIFIIGIPTGLNSVAFSISNVILQSSVNSFGPIVMAGNSGADTIGNLVALFPGQMNAACSCAVAQCYGAKNFPRIKESLRKGILGTVLMTLGACVVVTLFAMPIMKLFTDDIAVAQAGIPKLMFSIWGYVIYVFSLMFAGALKGMHHSSIMMILNVVGICLPRVLWVWFVFPFFNTPTMLYLIYPISYLISAVLLGFVYRSKLKKHIENHAQSLAT